MFREMVFRRRDNHISSSRLLFQSACTNPKNNVPAIPRSTMALPNSILDWCH
ncbi:unnamed protein product [Ectocarpus sp. CCAP 1310/34]|nr:unnamed protein product [Ectocarpus sp. CCAP 1310/34]